MSWDGSASASSSPPSSSTYLTESAATALVEFRSNSAVWTATSVAERAKALYEATRHIDALPLRGRKYDLVVTSGIPDQLLEFPRIIDGVTLDWNNSTNEAIVPADVKQACLEEAIAIIEAGSGGRRALQEQGVQSFSLGRGELSETFVPGAASRFRGLLSATAHRRLLKYIAGSVPII